MVKGGFNYLFRKTGASEQFMCVCHSICSLQCEQSFNTRETMLKLLNPGALKVFSNWTIMFTLQKYLTPASRLSLLIACGNPLQETWHFCSTTNILTL